MPDVIVISGPNGAGKSTLAPHFLRDTIGIVEYVNADTLAQGLSAFAPENAAFDAGRIMLKRLRELAAHRRDFAFETTLATRFYSRWIRELQSSGYQFHLVYLWLDSVDLAIERVKERVRSGGHDVPEQTIRRRYDRGRLNFVELYLPIADAWRVFDASPSVPRKIACGDKISGTEIIDKSVWKNLSD